MGLTLSLRASRRGGGGAPPAALTYLPTVGTAPVALGTRKGVSTYSGPAIRIRKSDVDASETDINFAATGYIDTAAIMAFTGLATIDGTLITRVYIQDGSGTFAEQPTLANMPHLATDPDGKPVVAWWTSGRYLLLPDSLSLTSTTASFFHLGRHTSGAIFQYGIGSAVQSVSTNAARIAYGTSVSRASAFVPYENVSVIGMVSGASLVWSIDGTLSTAASPAIAATTTGGRLGNSTAANTSQVGQSRLWVFYPATLSVGDAAAVRTAMMTMGDIAAKNKVLVFSEDSYSAGTGAEYNRNRTYYALTDPAIRANVRIYNKGKGGRRLDVANTDFATEGPPIYDATAAKNIWLVMGGANDSAQGDSAAAAFADLQAYIASIQAAGFETVPYFIPIGGAGAAIHDAFNALVAANYTPYVDLDAAGYNTRVDGTHPGSPGYLAWWNYEAPTVKAKLAL